MPVFKLMKSEQLVSVFEDTQLLRETIGMLCRDRLPRIAQSSDPQDESLRKQAVDQLCWDLISLQSKNFPFSILVEKCSASLRRSPYGPLRYLRAEEVANEICSPIGGW
jgi:hypothetical protein